MDTQGIKRLLLGIDISISGVLLALTSSGMGAVVLLCGLVGLVICISSMVTPSRS